MRRRQNNFDESFAVPAQAAMNQSALLAFAFGALKADVAGNLFPVVRIFLGIKRQSNLSF